MDWAFRCCCLVVRVVEALIMMVPSAYAIWRRNFKVSMGKTSVGQGRSVLSGGNTADMSLPS